jgi:hypothetical protein
MPQRRAPCHAAVDRRPRQRWLTELVAIGNERKIDAAQRRDLLLPVGSAHRRFDDDEPLRLRVPFELKTAQALVVGDVEKFPRQWLETVGRFRSGDADRRAAELWRVGRDLAAKEDVGGRQLLAAMKKRKIDVAVRPVDPFLNHELSGRIQHSLADNRCFVGGADVTEALGASGVYSVLVGRFDDDRIVQARQSRKVRVLPESNRPGQRQVMLFGECVKQALVRQRRHHCGRGQMKPVE